MAKSDSDAPQTQVLRNEEPTHDEYDVVVIGSGMGGLTCASLLAYANKHVLVLEKHEVPGGCLQTVERSDGDLSWSWNYGLQYLALFSKPIKESFLLTMLTEPPVKLASLYQNDDDGKYKDLQSPGGEKGDLVPKGKIPAFQKIKLPEFGEEYLLWGDEEKMRQYLIGQFPELESNINLLWDDYIKNIGDLGTSLMMPKTLPPFLARLLYPYLTRELKPYMELNFDEAMHEIFPDTDQGKRIKLLLANFWNFMGLPVETNFVFWCIAMDMQMHGIYVPKGGSKALVDGFIGFIRTKQVKNTTGETAHGEVCWGADHAVTKIVTEGQRNKKAVAVHLANGKTIRAKKIVSAIGLPQTVGPLVSESEFPKRLQKTLKKYTSVPSNTVLRIAFKKELTYDKMTELGIEHTGYRTLCNEAWNMDDCPTEKDWQPLDVLTVFPRFYFCESGSTELMTAEVLCQPSFNKFFEQYSESDEESYKEAEKNIYDNLRDYFVKEFPQLEPYIDDEHTWLTSPLRIRDETGHEAGSIYGIDSYKILDIDILPRSGIGNLYFSGEDTYAQGVSPCNGMLTASVILADDMMKTMLPSALTMLAYMPKCVVNLFRQRNEKYSMSPMVRAILTDKGWRKKWSPKPLV